MAAKTPQTATTDHLGARRLKARLAKMEPAQRAAETARMTQRWEADRPQREARIQRYLDAPIPADPGSPAALAFTRFRARMATRARVPPWERGDQLDRLRKAIAMQRAAVKAKRLGE